jgi:hypothetical protein
MGIEIHTFTRKTFTVEAIKLTEENIHAVALWCRGTIAKTLDGKDQLYIAMRRPGLPYERSELMAFPGNWVVHNLLQKSFRPYEEGVFFHSFIPTDRSDDEKLSEVVRLVKLAMIEYGLAVQKRDVSGTAGTANEYAEKIMELFQKMP